MKSWPGPGRVFRRAGAHNFDSPTRTPPPGLICLCGDYTWRQWQRVLKHRRDPRPQLRTGITRA
jgi:hypothetical protein